MAQDKQPFDPDATVSQATPGAAIDPEATISQPLPADPEATITQAMPLADPEATVTQFKPGPDPDPEATDRRPAFDPDATDRRPAFDPEATLLRAAVREHAKQKRNPFAPKAPPETVQASLASLGGVNPLVAMANPILAAVPQIRRTLRHPDPAALRASLQEQIESFETRAISAEVTDDATASAVYAMCALLDESAAATPWGQDWIANGLLHALRGETGGAAGFFAQLDALAADPEKNADLLEFYDICLALGFEGRYRDQEGGRQALEQLRGALYSQIARRRPRPDALSDQWRTPAAQAAVDAALRTADRANAARAAAEAAARAAQASPARPQPAGRFALSQWPRRAIWSAVAGLVGASFVLYLLGLRLVSDRQQDALSAAPNYRAGSGKKDASAPAAVTSAPIAAAAPADALARALAGQAVVVAPHPGGILLSFREPHQFGPGSAAPASRLHAALKAVGLALEAQPGAIVISGHADATPAGARYASNADLASARASAVARLLATQLSDPRRVTTESRGDAEPLAPNDTDENRARNRRVTILLKSAP